MHWRLRESRHNASWAYITQRSSLTPGTSSDILEGINRRTIIELAATMNIPVVERVVDLTELYVADEIFACGTSAFVAPITEIDKRVVGNGGIGAMTSLIREKHHALLHGEDATFAHYLTAVQQKDVARLTPTLAPIS